MPDCQETSQKMNNFTQKTVVHNDLLLLSNSTDFYQSNIQSLFIVVNMFEEHIFASLHEKIGKSIKNTHLILRGEPTTTSLRSFPQLTPQQIHLLCKAQEQTILHKILTVRPLDIYDEIAAVCPEGKDIKTISNEEVDQRIGSKLLMASRELSEDEGSSYQDTSREQSFFSQIHADGIGGMELIEEEPNLPGEFNSICKIFEICQNHSSWNPQDILEFN